MARIIAVVNLKGGSAKTTTAAAVGSELARCGKLVMLVDMDGQGHLAESFGIRALSLKTTMADVLTGDAALGQALVSLSDNLGLLPSNLRLAQIEPQLINETGRENKLRNVLREQMRLDVVDYVLIDCPPSVGIYTVNALAAADEVLIPMTAEFFALTGVSMLLDSLNRIRRGLDHEVGIAGVVPTRVSRTVHSREVIEQAKRQLPGVRFLTPIPEAVAVKDATIAGKPITEYAPDNPAAVAYRGVAKELLDG